MVLRRDLVFPISYAHRKESLSWGWVWWIRLTDLPQADTAHCCFSTVLLLPGSSFFYWERHIILNNETTECVRVCFLSLSPSSPALSIIYTQVITNTQAHSHSSSIGKASLGFSFHGCFSSTRWQPARNLNKPLLSPMPLLDELFVETHIIVPMENCAIFHVFPHEICNAWWRCTAVKRNCTSWAWLGSLYPIGSYRSYSFDHLEPETAINWMMIPNLY